MTFRTMRQAVAALRRGIQQRGLGATIVIHAEGCDARGDGPCTCRPRRQHVRARRAA